MTNKTFKWTFKHSDDSRKINIGIINNKHHHDINKNINTKDVYLYVFI